LTGSIPVLAATPPACDGGGWQIVPSPRAGPLSAVAATSRTDAWAVGEKFTGSFRTLIEHWDGLSWQVVASPNPAGRTDSQLAGVLALSRRNAWAFGFAQRTGHSDRTLILHWNGLHWSIVPSPDIGAGDNFLLAGAARSASSIWVVGSHEAHVHSRTLTEHWNGAAWSVVPSPNAGTGDDVLLGVAVAPGGPVLAVGSDSAGTGQTLAMRWNGSSWTVSPTADPGGSLRSFTAISAPTANRALAIGGDVTGHRTLAFGQRWNGAAWTQVPAANPGALLNSLQAITATSPVNAWAVGNTQPTPRKAERTLAEHWDGTSWTKFPVPNPARRDNTLSGIATIPGRGGFWAVGRSDNAGLIEFRCRAPR
jgi:hypothetical protein